MMEFLGCGVGFIFSLALLLFIFSPVLGFLYLIYMSLKPYDVRIIAVADGTYQVEHGKFFIKRYPTWFDWDCERADYYGWYKYYSSYFTLEEAIEIRDAKLQKMKTEKHEVRAKKRKGVVN